AGFTLLPGHKKRLLLQGRLKAKITQSCVVTLKPVITDLDIAIERTFTDAIKGPRNDSGEPDEEGFLSTGGQVKNLPDQPDLLVDGGIDLGEVASQQLAIEIDPFPRLDSAAMEDKVQMIETQEVENRENPFAVLQGLKKKLK
ncbi:MAG TPA: DUF177 domain-containing protein, partial [Rhodospirillales bacterium]|nr:DUF177 domain-containing protein [Rhodospirillales bacterium]